MVTKFTLKTVPMDHKVDSSRLNRLFMVADVLRSGVVLEPTQ